MSAGGPTFIYNSVHNYNPVMEISAHILSICDKVTASLVHCSDGLRYSNNGTNLPKKRLIIRARIDSVRQGEMRIGVGTQKHIEFNKTVARPSKPDFKFGHKKVTQKDDVPEPINARN